MFEIVTNLQLRLTSNNRLRTTQYGQASIVECTWENPCNRSDLEGDDKELLNLLPSDYKEYLSTISDGSLLFYDTAHGQWGCRLLGTKNLIAKHNEFNEVFYNMLGTQYLMFAELIAECNVLAFDLSKPTEDGKSFSVVQVEAISSKPEEWYFASRSFHEWISHYIVAQGSQYWHWR